MNSSIVCGAAGFLLTFGIAISFYWLRRRCRVLYGVVKILIGLLLMAGVWLPPTGPIPLDVSDGQPSIWFYTLQILIASSGVYIFVRGLDDIDTALPSSTWRERLELARR